MDMASDAALDTDSLGPEQTTMVRAPFSGRPAGAWAIRIGTLLTILIAWEIYGSSTNPALFAPFSKVVTSFYELAIQSDELWSAMWNSAQAMLVGFASAIPVGILLGLLMGRYRTIEYVLDPYVSFMYALPMVVLVPLLIIWLGIGPTVRVFIVFLMSVFPIIINTMVGAKQVDQDLIDVALVNCANERQTLRTVVIPSVLPYVFTGLHVGIGAALIGMVLGEMLVVLKGLGGLIVVFSNSYQPAKVIVPLFAIVAESLILVTIMRRLRKRLMPWS